MGRNYKGILKIKLADYLDCNSTDITLFWKGRIGLYGILKNLGIGEGDEVILPAYTCVVVPNAIIYLGAKPVYVDIDPKTYNIDVNQVEEKITDRTKVIIAQNTYGLSSDIDGLKTLCSKYDLRIIEDCTHGFGGFYKGVKNGKNVDVAFYSSQWNKMFSTGIGGIVISSIDDVSNGMIEFESSLEEPSFYEQAMLKAQIFLKDLIGYGWFYWIAIRTYRYLTERNIILGSSSGEEVSGIIMPDDYLKGFSNVQAKRAIHELERIEDNIRHRKLVTEFYKTIFNDLNITLPVEPSYAMHTFIKFPVLVKDRDLIFKEAERYKIPIHDWFTSPLHPVEGDLEQWGFDKNQYPVATDIAKNIINLPTDFSVTNAMMKRIGKFIRNNVDQFK